MHVLINRTDALGDTVLTLPMATMLKKNFEIISKLITIDSSVETMSTMNNPDSKIYQKLL